MRAAVVILLALAAAVASAAPRTTALGYDHYAHDKSLFVGGKDPQPCSRCHTLQAGKLAGKPDHDSCFGAGCHGAPPARPKRGGKLELGERAKICETCHAEAALVAPFTGKLAVPYPPYTLDRDFNLAFGHKQHATAACTGCHTTAGKLPGDAHARCVTCHAKKMDLCASCHPPASGKPQPPELRALHDTVTTSFSHDKHAGRGAHGKDCNTCHAAIRASDDSELPRPTVKDCATAGCHDGKAAFATTTACTRCHDHPPEERFTVWRPTARFSHTGSHAKVVASDPCSACHPIVGNEIVVAGHAACATCHADDFGLRKPTICGACHNATEPWRHLVTDRSPAERTEFGATLDHGKHAGECTSCHLLRTPSAQLRPPRGHRACTAAGCHVAGKGGPAPALDDCAACHRAGLAAERVAERAKAPWSTRTKFDHADHAHDAAGVAIACTACHTDVAGKDVLAVPAPAKKTCAPCHDGGKAFSLTGTGCTRCHVGAKK